MRHRKPPKSPEPVAEYTLPLTPQYLKAAKHIERWYAVDIWFTRVVLLVISVFVVLQVLALLAKPDSVWGWVSILIYLGTGWLYTRDFKRARDRRNAAYVTLCRNIVMDYGIQQLIEQEEDQA